MMWCMACGQECRSVEVDFGIGPYEFWGFRGVDRDVRLVSNCCEHEVTDVEPSLTEPDDDLIPAAQVVPGE